MEEVRILQFLSSGYGDGSGYGSGDGSGDGSGYGSGDGYGDGSGDGSGYGSGDGYGDGYGSGSGIKSINGMRIYFIDNVPTIITRIKGSYAKGYILKGDLSLEECFVARTGGYFAHGDTLRSALEAARSKAFNMMPEEDRIRMFVDEHDACSEYPTMDFFVWHNRLTGSCEMGRKAFAERHGINLDGCMTVSQFIGLTENDYGGSTIRKLKEHYSECAEK